ncbi:glycine zipper family protein [Motilimonas eburnea]|nr:glycine zipper family protein [Motilimonas eburnea]
MGCSYNRAPVVDMTKVDPQQYQADREYCESYAEQLDKQEYAKTEGINGAVSGALVGGVAGAIDEGLEGALIGAAIGSAIGAGAGALGGANDATKQQALVLRNCLEQKGYKVYDKE